VALEERGIVSELAASNKVAKWAYEQTEAAGGLTWLKGSRWSRCGPTGGSWCEWRGERLGISAKVVRVDRNEWP
jgi:hypothetical protein